jgi:hypothetical protein
VRYAYGSGQHQLFEQPVRTNRAPRCDIERASKPDPQRTSPGCANRGRAGAWEAYVGGLHSQIVFRVLAQGDRSQPAGARANATHGPRALRLSGLLQPSSVLPYGEPCLRRSRPCHTLSPCVARALRTLLIKPAPFDVPHRQHLPMISLPSAGGPSRQHRRYP